MASLTIGQVATRSGVRPDTVRYYEKRGLLPRAARRPSGYRTFEPETVERITFIKRIQELGFSLDEIAQMLELYGNHDSRCSDVKELAEDKKSDIERRIADLVRIRDALAELSACCDTDTRMDECELLSCLQSVAPGNGSASRALLT